MTNRTETLENAVKCVEQEQQELKQEIEAFEAFREAVGHIPIASSKNGSTGMGDIFEIYCEQVVETLDYEELGEPSQESLKTEFTPTLVNALLNDQPLTQRRKRNLLLSVNQSIDRRTTFSNFLEREQKSLQTVRESLFDIEQSLHELPTYSLEQSRFEEAIDIWRACEEFLKRCDQLAELRQRQFRECSLLSGSEIGPHTLNEYLYASLETQFPALSAIIDLRRCIEQYRDEPDSQDGSSVASRNNPSMTTEPSA